MTTSKHPNDSAQHQDLFANGPKIGPEHPVETISTFSLEDVTHSCVGVPETTLTLHGAPHDPEAALRGELKEPYWITLDHLGARQLASVLRASPQQPLPGGMDEQWEDDRWISAELLTPGQVDSICAARVLWNGQTILSLRWSDVFNSATHHFVIGEALSSQLAQALEEQAQRLEQAEVELTTRLGGAELVRQLRGWDLAVRRGHPGGASSPAPGVMVGAAPTRSGALMLGPGTARGQLVNDNPTLQIVFDGPDGLQVSQRQLQKIGAQLSPRALLVAMSSQMHLTSPEALRAQLRSAPTQLPVEVHAIILSER